jgi:peptidylprolyl isomerase
MRLALTAFTLLALAACAHAPVPVPAPAIAAPVAAPPAEPATPASVVAAAPASAWKPIDPADLLVMDLAPDAAGRPRRVIIQLMPPPFSQGWVENIRTLAKAHWWDGTSVYRVVDNWVAQWGDVDEAKPLPAGIREVSEACYDLQQFDQVCPSAQIDAAIEGAAALAEDNESPTEWRSRDSYANWVDFLFGWPIAMAQDPKTRAWNIWPTHCYGTVGVARSVGSGGTGSELYAVIGHAPRQLDRNIGVAGRVIEGIEHLSVLPRGTGEAGVYETAEERVPIVSVRLGNEVPQLPQPAFEYLDTASEAFSEYVRIRANRHDSFYLHPAGGVDVCNIQVPIRRVMSE